MFESHTTYHTSRAHTTSSDSSTVVFGPPAEDSKVCFLGMRVYDGVVMAMILMMLIVMMIALFMAACRVDVC